ncbi:unnamed protein product [Haemonchus placei]|uniref:Cation transport protein n=1 Tax=Haemonchus placei TaxID=6290 RepID=A0A0N4VX20_HAEPC|nr:unnamed protein product [Haemonchus placei]
MLNVRHKISFLSLFIEAFSMVFQTALVVAYPTPHEAAKTSVIVLMVIIFGPIPLFAISKTAYMIRRKIPLRALYKPDFYLWGPRNDENRVRAAAWEKKVRLRGITQRTPCRQVLTDVLHPVLRQILRESFLTLLH